MRIEATWRPRLIGMLVFCALLTLSSCGGGKQAPTATGPTPTPKPLSDIDFLEDIRQQRVDAIRLTDWEKYRDTLIGSRVQWTGTILHIVDAEGMRDTSEIRLELDPPDALFKHYDAFFRLPKAQAAQYVKGQEITVQGDIAEIKELAGTVGLVLTVHLTQPVIVKP
ncbi:MAG: hypothetical protein FJZ90_16695 [Chloroflexi bacterium]|nr:hypothetical protein [Chloroflexota bacterium]